MIAKGPTATLFVAAALAAGCRTPEPASKIPESDLAPGSTIATTGRLDREQVKWATDRKASGIETEPQDTDIAALLAIARPEALAEDNSALAYQELRIAPLETHVWRLSATVTSVVVRDDGDIYLVLVDENDQTIVAESPVPEDCKSSPFFGQIGAAHALLIERFHPTQAPQTVSQKATLTGIGFFGRATNKEGAHHNGARLMPLLDVKFE